MEYSINARFENKGLEIKIHFISMIDVNDEIEANLFFDQLLSGFRRMKWEESCTYLLRIDNNESRKNKMYADLNQIETNSSNFLKIEQYLLENPDQTTSLSENIIKHMQVNKEKSSEVLFRKFSIPIEVKNSSSGRNITGEFYYLKVEQFIPKKI